MPSMLLHIALFLAGGMMLTRWTQFYWLLPLTFPIGASLATLFWAAARLLRPAVQRRAWWLGFIVGATYFAIVAADVYWSGWREPLRRTYVLGGAEAIAIALTLTFLGAFALERLCWLLLRFWKQRRPRSIPGAV